MPLQGGLHEDTRTQNSRGHSLLLYNKPHHFFDEGGCLWNPSSQSLNPVIPYAHV